MSFWKFSEYAPIILRSWCDYADKTSNECITDKGKYDLGFGRDADGTEYRYYCVCRDSYRDDDSDKMKYVWYDEFRFHQHYKGGYEICKDWEDIEK